MKYIILDLEWNGATTESGYFNEIIEIGAVALDDRMRKVGEFQSFVNPKVTKKLRGRIRELTHISNDDLKNASGFAAVFARFKAWIGSKEDNCMMSWGNGDITVLYENLAHYDMLDEIYVIRHYCDAQLMCQKAADISLTRQVGLSAFAELVGVEIGDELLHRAINDSRLTARCVAKMFRPEIYADFVQRADREFYERMNFKSYCIQDLNDEMIHPSDFMTKCPECDCYMKRISGYSCRNKKHYALYRCKFCKKTFHVGHTFKVTYDGLEHRLAYHQVDPPLEAPEAASAEANTAAGEAMAQETGKGA